MNKNIIANVSALAAVAALSLATATAAPASTPKGIRLATEAHPPSGPAAVSSARHPGAYLRQDTEQRDVDSKGRQVLASSHRHLATPRCVYKVARDGASKEATTVMIHR